MIVVGLVHDPGRRLPEEPPEPDREWRVPYRAIARLVVWWVLLAVAPAVGDALSPIVGYALLMLTVALGFHWLEAWCARQHWSGLRDFRL